MVRILVIYIIGNIPINGDNAKLLLLLSAKLYESLKKIRADSICRSQP